MPNSPVKPNSQLDRLPPHSIEAEQGVLGCMLRDPAQCIPEAMAFFKAGSPVFYDARHKLLYSAILELSNEGSGIDAITLISRLKDKGHLDKVGGQVYVSWLPEQVTVGSRFSDYTDIVRTKYALRQTLASIMELNNKIHEHHGTAREFIESYEESAFALSSEFADTREEVPVKELARRAVGILEEIHANKGAPTGLTTGLRDLDKMTRGLMPSQMWVIAGRPSLGKTSIAMQIAEHVGVDLNEPVGVFSLEMSAEQLIVRMICSRARINILDLNQNGEFTHGDMERLTTAAVKIANSNLHINDQAGLSILELRAKARRMFQLHKIKLFVIDYLGLLHSTSRKATNRQQEVADISQGVKNLAKELKVPIILLSQLNRDADKQERRPQLCDLRESGSIEQDADIVGMLYKPDAQADEKAPVVPVSLYIAKQRNGPVGDIPMIFRRGITRFELAAYTLDPKDIPNEPRTKNTGAAQPGADAAPAAEDGECPF